MKNSFFTTFNLAHRPYMNELQSRLQVFSMTGIQWGIIRYIAEAGPATFSDVATYWRVEKPSITPVANKLIEEGLIYISTGQDKRQKFMHLSEKGNVKYTQVKEAINLFQEELLEGITDTEKEMAERVLEKLTVNILKRG